MTDARLTRRALVRSGAAGALSLAAGRAASAADAAAAPSVIEIGLLGRGVSKPIVLAAGADMLAAQWQEPRRGAQLELRVQLPAGGWSRWAQAAALHGPDVMTPAPNVLAGEPVWVGGAARAVQLRSAQTMRGVRLHLLRAAVPAGEAPLAGEASAALAVLPAGPGQPTIIPRERWAGSALPPRVTPGYGEIHVAFVHHTESLNGYSSKQAAAIVRAIGQFHRDVRGWNDIGYNFLVDRFGRIYEGRRGGIDQPVVGAQAGGYNGSSTGVALLGTFSGARPPRAAARSLEHLLAWKLALHGVPAQGRGRVQVNPAGAAYARFPTGAYVSLPRVSGHRDGCSTNCPGAALYGELPQIRRAVSRLAGRPATLTLALPGAPAVVGAPLTLTGRLAFADDASPIAGAPIELRERIAGGRETLLARAQSAADGSWQAAITLQRAAPVRAVHPAAPARVSPAIDVAVAPAISLLQSAPGQLSGTVNPPKAAVSIDVYAVGAGGVLSRAAGPLQARVSLDGAFSLTLPPLPPSAATPYIAVAHTAADTNYAAGSSPALTLS